MFGYIPKLSKKSLPPTASHPTDQLSHKLIDIFAGSVPFLDTRVEIQGEITPNRKTPSKTRHLVFCLRQRQISDRPRRKGVMDEQIGCPRYKVLMQSSNRLLLMGSIGQYHSTAWYAMFNAQRLPPNSSIPMQVLLLVIYINTARSCIDRSQNTERRCQRPLPGP